ncbi:MAG TPA: hypothetical protein VN515_04220 [Terriglobales bacterium]|nr:hypothetical protein [Terriglobales bacterium]
MTIDRELENELRAALRRQPPPRDLTPGVLAAVCRPGPRPRRWVAVLAAACVLLAVVAGMAQWREQAARRQEAAARADARQLVFALRLTAADLGRVQRHLH